MTVICDAGRCSCQVDWLTKGGKVLYNKLLSESRTCNKMLPSFSEWPGLTTREHTTIVDQQWWFPVWSNNFYIKGTCELQYW